MSEGKSSGWLLWSIGALMGSFIATLIAYFHSTSDWGFSMIPALGASIPQLVMLGLIARPGNQTGERGIAFGAAALAVLVFTIAIAIWTNNGLDLIGHAWPFFMLVYSVVLGIVAVAAYTAAAIVASSIGQK